MLYAHRDTGSALLATHTHRLHCTSIVVGAWVDTPFICIDALDAPWWRGPGVRERNELYHSLSRASASESYSVLPNSERAI